MPARKRMTIVYNIKYDDDDRGNGNGNGNEGLYILLTLTWLAFFFFCSGNAIKSKLNYLLRKPTHNTHPICNPSSHYALIGF